MCFDRSHSYTKQLTILFLGHLYFVLDIYMYFVLQLFKCYRTPNLKIRGLAGDSQKVSEIMYMSIWEWLMTTEKWLNTSDRWIESRNNQRESKSDKGNELLYDNDTSLPPAICHSFPPSPFLPVFKYFPMFPSLRHFWPFLSQCLLLALRAEEIKAMKGTHANGKELPSASFLLTLYWN